MLEWPFLAVIKNCSCTSSISIFFGVRSSLLEEEEMDTVVTSLVQASNAFPVIKMSLSMLIIVLRMAIIESTVDLKQDKMSVSTLA